MKTIHIHVTTTVQTADLHEADRKIPGVYVAEVADGLPEGVASWAAFEAFHKNVEVKRMNDFAVDFFDPNAEQYVHVFTPSSLNGIQHKFIGKIADQVPRICMRVTLDVSYYGRGVSVDALQKALTRMVEQGVSKQGLTGMTQATVAQYSVDVAQVIDEPEALKAENLTDARTDYKLQPEVTGCWINVDTASVHIMRVGEGIIVDILAKDGSADALSTAQLTHNDIEGELCEIYGVDIDDVGIQYEYAHPNGPAFDSLSPVDRVAHIKEVAESTAKVAAVIASTSGDSSDDDMAARDLAGVFATASFR